MRKLPWAALCLVSATALTNVLFTGCGSESDPEETPDSGNPNNEGGNAPDTSTPPDAGGDGFISTIDGGRADAADCKLQAATCASSAECCSLNCDLTTKQCDSPLTVCGAPGATCASGPECCTFACIGGKCDSKLCVADNLACAKNEECCGGTCAPDGAGGGKCTPLNGPGPKTDGNPCATNTDCASKLCNSGVCEPSSFCQQNGDVCGADTDCCGGACTKAAGAALGTCGLTKATGAGGCDPGGTICANPTDAACGGACCTRSCAPYAPTGASVCQPASGCHVTGELCRANSDCCGWSGSPDPKKGFVVCRKDSATQEFGLCDKGAACTEPGTLCGQVGDTSVGSCSASNDCCDPIGFPSGYCNTVATRGNCCAFDTLGIPRCLIKPVDCVGNPPTNTTVCATSADCCGKPCVNNLCATACIPAAGTCSADSDCCAGLPCTIPSGSTKGVCGGTALPDGGVGAPTDGGTVVTQDGGTAGDGGVCGLYGQACAQNSDCCSGVPCTNGSCHYP